MPRRLAFRATPQSAIDGMFIGIDEPTHSLRWGRDAHGPLLVALGPTFYTGHNGDVAERFRQLESWVRHNLPVEDAAWRWLNEDFNTADWVPYVGVPSAEIENFYIATDFNGWGISNGTTAGMLIADQILKRPNPWAELFDPSRPSPKGFNKGGDTQSCVRALADILPGEGGLTVGEEGCRGVERGRWDAARVLRVMHAQGCTLTWNNADRTWDCPCNGSIFSADGVVIHGPAVTPLVPHAMPPN
jgi:hypothetical protein